MKHIHFIGIGGIGMSALAQIHAMSGDKVSGSDRLIDKGYLNLPIWEKLKKLNIKLFPQNGSGISSNTDTVVLSSAIENDNSDLLKTLKLKLPVIHRSELLSHYVAKFKTIAVCGTSGKSTTTAMIYEILKYSNYSPSVITGGHIISLQEKGLLGNVSLGDSETLVIEADESDGSLLNYHPSIAVMLNLTKDHKELDVLFGYFRKFRDNCDKFIVNADAENITEMQKDNLTFGIKYGNLCAENIRLDAFSCRFTVNGIKFLLPATGLHNVYNAIAAIAACIEIDIPLEQCASGLEKFKGVARRFSSIGIYNGIEVIDDFAHNPSKISAALSAAHLRGKRVLAFYQPHGYAPLKLFKNELIHAFTNGLNKDDIIWLPEIYYAGGTVKKDISSKYISDALLANGVNAQFIASRKKIISEIVENAVSGDVIIVMGARDPSLTDYAKALFQAVKNEYISASLLNTKPKAIFKADMNKGRKNLF